MFFEIWKKTKNTYSRTLTGPQLILRYAFYMRRAVYDVSVQKRNVKYPKHTWECWVWQCLVDSAVKSVDRRIPVWHAVLNSWKSWPEPPCHPTCRTRCDCVLDSDTFLDRLLCTDWSRERSSHQGQCRSNCSLHTSLQKALCKNKWCLYLISKNMSTYNDSLRTCIHLQRPASTCVPNSTSHIGYSEHIQFHIFCSPLESGLWWSRREFNSYRPTPRVGDVNWTICCKRASDAAWPKCQLFKSST